MEPFSKHGYIYTFPTIKFGSNIFGKDIESASELRKMYSTLTDNQKMNLIKKMYTSNHDKIKKIFDKHLASYSSEENEVNSFLGKELMKDTDKAFGNKLTNPPYQADGGLTVGRMMY